MTFYIETYGCQMNKCDSMLVREILLSAGFTAALGLLDADLVLVNTCSVRAKAEQKVLQRLHNLFHALRAGGRLVPPVIVGVLGCMASRLKSDLFSLNDIITLVCGPDDYHRLPELIQQARRGGSALAATLSGEQNYESIISHPEAGALSSYVTIMRGCNNFCSYCIVPFVRGPERSRSVSSILAEVSAHVALGIKEICLLGQNVNSYRSVMDGGTADLSDLLSALAERYPELWIRFLTSHPRDMSSAIIRTIARYSNICRAIHLPVQSGSDRLLEQMNRQYTVARYMDLIAEIKSTIPDVSLSTDIIAGYPGESLADHHASLQLVESVRYDNAYMFRYSRRAGTAAALQPDDVAEAEKIRRLNEIIALQNTISAEINLQLHGRTIFGMALKPSRRQADN